MRVITGCLVFLIASASVTPAASPPPPPREDSRFVAAHAAEQGTAEEAAPVGASGSSAGVDRSTPAAAASGSGATVAVAQVPYTDVAAGSVHRENIQALAEDGIFDSTDCGLGLFCPDRPLPRWVMAVWLVRILEGGDPPSKPSRFADIDDSRWWAGHVERLAELGVTAGCEVEPLRYCPDMTVTRAQMASFLTRAFDLPAGLGAGFADVASGNVHRANIDALASSGVTVGCRTEPLRFCPQSGTSRAQMATFLVRGIEAGTRRVGVTQGCYNPLALTEDRFVPSVIADQSRCEPWRLGYLDDDPMVLGQRASFGNDSRDGWKKHDPSDKPPFRDDGIASGDWVFGRNGGWYTQRITDTEQTAKWMFRNESLRPGSYSLAVFIPHLGSQDREQPGARPEYRIYESTDDGLVLRRRCDLDQGARAGWTIVPDCAVNLDGRVEVYVGGTGVTAGQRAAEEHRHVLAVDAAALVPSASTLDDGESRSGLPFDFPSDVRAKSREAQDACAIDAGHKPEDWTGIVRLMAGLGADAAFEVIGGAVGGAVGAAIGSAVPGIGTALGAAAGIAIGVAAGRLADVAKRLIGWAFETEDKREETLQAQRLCHFEDYWRNYYDYHRDQSGRATTHGTSGSGSGQHR